MHLSHVLLLAAALVAATVAPVHAADHPGGSTSTDAAGSTGKPHRQKTEVEQEIRKLKEKLGRCEFTLADAKKLQELKLKKKAEKAARRKTKGKPEKSEEEKKAKVDKKKAKLDKKKAKAAKGSRYRELKQMAYAGLLNPESNECEEWKVLYAEHRAKKKAKKNAIKACMRDQKKTKAECKQIVKAKKMATKASKAQTLGNH